MPNRTALEEKTAQALRAAALELCTRNDSGSECWTDASFAGRLTEEGIFDPALYEDLERAMIAVAQGAPDAQAVWVLLRILERVTLMISCHLDPGDAYRIVNLSDDEVADFNNRFRFLLRGLSLEKPA